MDWGDVASVLIGVVITRLWIWGVDRYERPYRWRCKEKGCSAYVATNAKETMEYVKATHFQQRHQEV